MDSQRGFTLIELMVVVVIVAILAGIGFPAYTDYVRRGKMAEAVSQLSGMRVKMEQWFQDNRDYRNSGGTACGPAMPVASDGAKYFTYTGACTASGYTLTATGNAAQGMSGFIYTIDQNNTRKTTGLPADWTGSGNSCWVLRKDGSC